MVLKKWVALIERRSWPLALELAGLMVIGAFFLPGGADLRNFYLPFAGGCLDCGVTPYVAVWLLAPLAWLPPGLAWPALTAVSLIILLTVCRFSGANPLWLLLSFPTLAMLWLGQIDALIVAGLALALLSPNPWLRGAGLALAAIKPQITGLALLVLLFYQRKSLLKVLAVPLAALLISLLTFGPDWPLRWLVNAMQALAHAYAIGVVDPLPYLLLPLLWLYHGQRRKVQAALFISVMASPYMGLYSGVVPLAFGLPGWGVRSPTSGFRPFCWGRWGCAWPGFSRRPC